MFIRQCYRKKNGTRHAYWALVESYRSEHGPRQRVVAWLGKLDEAGRLGVQQAAEGNQAAAASENQLTLFDEESEETEPRWVEVNTSAVRVENCRQFGGPWLAMELIRRLKLDEFLTRVMPQGREQVPWSLSSLVLVIGRLLDPSSELHTAEQWYPKTALPELLGVPVHRVDDNRLYRTLDELLPHKAALEVHLKERLGELFGIEYDLLLYDVTSTFFEGQAAFDLAQRGYSRDQRSDCKQVCIGLVVSRCGMPLGYEVFAGNTADVTTVQQIVTTMEQRYGKSERIWVMDRGMVSEANLRFLREGNRRYIVGTPKSMLKKFEQQILGEDWHKIREGLEVKLCELPRDAGQDDDVEEMVDSASAQDEVNKPPIETREIFILCRSQDRGKKEDAILRRFEQKIEERLKSMTARCDKQKRQPLTVAREVGRLLGQNTRAAKLFEVTVEATDEGHAKITWKKIENRRNWATLSAGCYLLRTNVTDWSDEELWKAYIQLTEAEAAFRIHKSDLSLRPVWHQKQERVLAHILICFLSYVLWKMLGQLCQTAGLGNEPRRVLSELSEIRMMDVILPTRDGIDIRKRCISQPSDHQQILLEKLRLKLPRKINSF
jgi:transposase